MSNRAIIIGIVAVLLIAGIGFWLFNMQNKSIQETPQDTTSESQTVPTQTTLPQEQATDAAAVSGSVKEITVQNKGLSFDKAEITVKEGDTVKLTFKVTQGRHNWTLDEFNAKTEVIGAGEEETVEFVADKKGEYEYYCSVPGHRQAGMKGMLIVE